MPVKRLSHPRDPIQLGELIGDIATGQVVDAVADGDDLVAAALGDEGGASRAAAMTPIQRTKTALAAAQVRQKNVERLSSGYGVA